MEAAVKAYQSVSQRKVRDHLIEDHLHFVRHVLGRIVSGLPGFVDKDNLESAGVLGLVEAAASFDPDRGVAFTSFAYHRIRGAILDELRRNCSLPQHVLETWNQVKRAWEQLGEYATSATVAAACRLSEEVVEECMTAMRFAQPDHWQESLHDHHFVSRESEEALDRLELADQQRILADAIERLPDRLRVVLSLYYLEDLRMAEIAQVVNLSESRVSRLLAEAELQIKNYLNQPKTASSKAVEKSRRSSRKS
ncbi:sigma-70 family RNA polymerase sigma factor [Planctomicrobium sp. SH527]|uniref:sigma-70 family RNA polymerase sigma factor n=1 Tax=Planctomicrobium sp. SH527 TaxID=3448123 RepID=UPI003F5CA276